MPSAPENSVAPKVVSDLIPSDAFSRARIAVDHPTDTNGAVVRSSLTPVPVNSDQYDVNLHVMWRDTDARLDSYAAKVREGRCLDEALEFAKWLQRAGFLMFFKHHSRDGQLKIDGHLLAWKSRELELAVYARYKAGDKPESRDTTLETILHRLDLIAGRIALMPVVDKPADIIEMPDVSTGTREG